MANINGNNMDDLFRQASDQYPLRTDSSDWDKLASALEADPSLISPPVIEQGDKRRRKRFLWLLLLLPLGGLGYYAIQSNIHARPGADMANAKGTNVDAAATGKRTTVAGTRTETGTETAEGTKSETGESAKPVKGQMVNSVMGERTRSETNAKPEPARGATSVMGAGTGQDQRPAISGTGVLRNHIAGNKAQENLTARDKAQENLTARDKAQENLTAGNEAQGDRTVGDEAQGDRTTEYKTAENKTTGNDRSGNDPAFSRVNGPVRNAAGDISVIADVRPKTGEIPGQTSAAPLKKTSPNKERHAIYVGILGAPDLSTIHMQSVKTVGTTFGILGGYSFNPKWSLETGVYLDMKRYYTEGQYFSKKNVQPLRYVDLLDVNGTCNMVEIPVNLRYNLSSGKSRKWFATAGLSTYLMSKEWYDYHYLSYGTPMDNAFTYRKPYHYLFSILNMSLGYEQKLGRIGNLRLEPYLRVPLSGIGTGSLSIMSAGLNVGITRRIW